MTPPPSPSHALLASRLRSLLGPYVRAHQLGDQFRPRAVVLSPTTSRRDQLQKRASYLRIGAAEYWIVDGETRTVRVVRAHADDVVVETEFVWQPVGVAVPLIINVDALFCGALG